MNDLAVSYRNDLTLGLDFGTAFSSAGVIVDGRIDWVLDCGEATIPTVVSQPRSGLMMVGSRAAARLPVDPANTIQSIKRLLGRDFASTEVRRLDAQVGYRIVAGPKKSLVLKVGGHDFAPEQVAAAVIDHIRGLAEKRFGRKVTKAVATMPASASDTYKKSLVRAAKLAHVEIVQFVPEPIAGALAMGLHSEPLNRTVVVCDYGGGTFDTTLMRQEGKVFTPLACAGDSLLGGDDFDDAFAAQVADQIFKTSRFDIRKDAVRWQLLRMRCELAKRELSFRDEASLTMRDAYIHRSQRKDINTNVSRGYVEACWQPLYERTRSVLQRLLDKANAGIRDIDAIVFIGGTCLIPSVRQTILDFFEAEEGITSPNAQIAVAYGATLQTAAHSEVAQSGAQLAG